MSLWARLREGLAGLPDDARVPAGARHGGALALLSDVGEADDASLLLTRRGDHLPQHAGQVSFPGGRVEPGETACDAALREAAEECGVEPSTVTVLGQLPTFYIPPSRWWLTVVVGRWDRPHPLEPDDREVAGLLAVRLSELCEPARWRATELPDRGTAWAWELDDGHLLWGATAIATAVLLSVTCPGWDRGQRPEDLCPDRLVHPRPSTASSAGGRP